MIRLYADHGATTGTDPQVLDAMLPFFSEKYGNASSVHQWGQEARAAVDVAREQIAAGIDAKPAEIVFTSGATESDNFAIFGAAYANETNGRHVVTSSIEHHALLESCRFLESRGWEVTYLPVDSHGVVDPDDVRRSIRKDTVLVSIMHANNEIGTIERIAEIGRIAKEQGVLMHTDAAQTLGIVPVHVDDLSVDLLSMSAHKRYGPKGVGALYIRKGANVSRVQHGGSHERNRRGGTENVPAIVGFGKAMQIAFASMGEEGPRLARMRDALVDVFSRIDGAHLNGHPSRRLPGNVNFSFEGVDSESILMALDFQGVAASSGSACTSGSLEPSHVLAAIGRPPHIAAGTIRLSLGRWNTLEDVAYLSRVVPEVITSLRGASRPVSPARG